ncbi:helix-turn-helix domain-containing protein [Clostridium sp.]
MNSNKEIAKILFDTRKLRGMTRVELGKIIDLHETTIRKYEMAQIKNISIEVLKNFAQALNLDPEYLIGWNEIEVVAATKQEDTHSFTVKLVHELLQANIINDKDNIPQEIIDMVIAALKADLKNKKR